MLRSPGEPTWSRAAAAAKDSIKRWVKRGKIICFAGWKWRWPDSSAAPTRQPQARPRPKVFRAAEGARLAAQRPRFHVHYMPTHTSWLV